MISAPRHEIGTAGASVLAEPTFRHTYMSLIYMCNTCSNRIELAYVTCMHGLHCRGYNAKAISNKLASQDQKPIDAHVRLQHLLHMTNSHGASLLVLLCDTHNDTDLLHGHLAQMAGSSVLANVIVSRAATASRRGSANVQ